MLFTGSAISLTVFFSKIIGITAHNCTVVTTKNGPNVSLTFQETDEIFTSEFVIVYFDNSTLQRVSEGDTKTVVLTASITNGTITPLPGTLDHLVYLKTELDEITRERRLQFQYPLKTVGEFTYQLGPEKVLHSCIFIKDATHKAAVDNSIEVPLIASSVTITFLILACAIIAFVKRNTVDKKFRKCRNNHDPSASDGEDIQGSRPLLDSISRGLSEFLPDKEYLTRTKQHVNAHLRLKRILTSSITHRTECGRVFVLEECDTEICIYLIFENKEISKMRFVLSPVKKGPCTQFFEFSAEKIAQFTRNHAMSVPDEKVPLIFLTMRDDDYLHKGIGGKEVAQILMEHLKAKQITNIEVEELLLCKSAGTLLYGVHLYKHCDIGLYIGKDYYTISCLTEKCSGSHTRYHSKKHVCRVDMGCTFEDFPYWNFLGTAMDTEFANLSNKEKWNKLTGEKHLGELVRLLILHLLSEKTLSFSEKDYEVLRAPMWLLSKYVEEIVESGEDTNKINSILTHDLHLENCNDDDCKSMQDVCILAFDRMTSILSSGLAGIIENLCQPNVTILIDGSGSLVLSQTFFTTLESKLKQQLQDSKLSFKVHNVVLEARAEMVEPIKRGCILGAALVAGHHLHCSTTALSV